MAVGALEITAGILDLGSLVLLFLGGGIVVSAAVMALDDRLRPNSQRTNPRFLRIAWWLGPPMLGGGVLCMFAAAPLRSRVDERVAAHVAERAAPVVGAVERYAAEHGAPPAELEALVPDYLASVPELGLMQARFVYGVDTGGWYLSAVDFECGLYCYYAPEPARPEYRGLPRSGDWVVARD